MATSLMVCSSICEQPNAPSARCRPPAQSHRVGSWCPSSGRWLSTWFSSLRALDNSHLERDFQALGSAFYWGKKSCCINEWHCMRTFSQDDNWLLALTTLVWVPPARVVDGASIFEMLTRFWASLFCFPWNDVAGSLWLFSSSMASVLEVVGAGCAWQGRALAAKGLGCWRNFETILENEEAMSFREVFCGTVAHRYCSPVDH